MIQAENSIDHVWTNKAPYAWILLPGGEQLRVEIEEGNLRVQLWYAGTDVMEEPEQSADLSLTP